MTRLLLLTAAFGCLAFGATAQAETEPRLAGQFSDWQVFTNGEGASKICYALTTPQAKSPQSVNHGKVYFMVASWQNGAAKEQPSLLTGYSFKVTSPPDARIGSSRTRMYVSQNEAFVESPRDEARLVANMRKGSTMRVSAMSQRGTQTSYEFSLKGITAALRKANDLCS